MAMASTPSLPPRDINPWLVAVAVMSSTFMEVLDTTVVNVSLPHIAGDLSASTDEATWTLTSYLVANVIIFRIIQGACGGGLQPLSQAILLEAFPPEKRGQAMAFWALGIVVAPMLGPVACGWLTDNYSWRWVFYINIPISALAIILTQLFVFDPSYLRKKSSGIDYWGIGLLVLGIGSLQIMLDKGQEEDWFGSHFIITLAVLAVIGLGGLIIRELKTDHPIIDLSVFRYRTYVIGTALMTGVGFVLYGSTVLLPLLMQVLLGYTATHAGVTNLPRGMASFMAMPLIGYLISKVDSRKLLGAGVILSAIAMFRLSRLSLDAGAGDFWWPLMLQGAALALIFVPLTTVTNDPIPKEKLGAATSIFNLMRNIGASIGISVVETLQYRKQQTHINILGSHVNPGNPIAQR